MPCEIWRSVMSDNDLEIVCRKIGDDVNRSWQILFAVCARLRDSNGVFVGGREEFISSFRSHTRNTIRVMVQDLCRNQIVITDRGKKLIHGYRLNTTKIIEMAKNDKPRPPRNGKSGRTTKTYRCKKCRHKVTRVERGICLGCETRDRVNKERGGMGKV
jgi:hypothetical protein